ncbi:MAG TPA: SDR family NAD(P)-dependent oxidoreductase [Puia sp.]|nr:SDR family NAD(P)-dependent oxidoreductase [Puia sp.]
MKKIAFITGASSGFGKACALKFAENQFDLILAARRIERLQALREKIEKDYGGRVLTLALDVQDKAAVFQAVASLAPQWQAIDVLVNNAGLALGRDNFDEASLSDWETMIDTNVKGLLYVSRAVLPLMISRRKGHIINIGSTAGKQVYHKGNVYCATKHAVDAISQSMRIDLLPHKIKVTAIHPGAAETEFSLIRLKQNKEEAKKVYEGYEPLHAVDIADIVFFTANLPEHVCINELEVTCLAQANAYYLFKETV